MTVPRCARKKIEAVSAPIRQGPRLAETPIVNSRRVEEWRGDEGYGLLPFQGFPGCGAISVCHAPFPLPALRTGQADFRHPAPGQDITPPACGWVHRNYP